MRVSGFSDNVDIERTARTRVYLRDEVTSSSDDLYVLINQLAGVVREGSKSEIENEIRLNNQRYVNQPLFVVKKEHLMTVKLDVTVTLEKCE
jgi:hypothetical protein